MAYAHPIRPLLPAGRALTPRPSRLSWLCLAVALIAGNLFCVLAFVVGRHGAPLPVDQSLHRWLLEHRNTALTGAAIAVTNTGVGPVAYLLAVLAGVLAAGRPEVDADAVDGTWGRRSWRWAVAAVLALGASQSVRNRLADWFARPRPPMADWAWPAHGLSFPSGHATTSALVAGMFVVACAHASDGRRRYVVVPAVALVWAVTVGLTRLYLGVHWPTDVVAGWLLAAALTLAATAVAVARRRP